MKVCCVTGHRDIPVSQITEIERQLKQEIQMAIDDGYTHFISGFADGIDLLFAKIVIDYKAAYPHLKLSAYLPSRSRAKTQNELFQKLLPQCDFVGVTTEGYFKGCELTRDRQMVDNSTRVIAVYDGRQKGGAFYTIKYARQKNRELHIIQIGKLVE